MLLFTLYNIMKSNFGVSCWTVCSPFSCIRDPFTQKIHYTSQSSFVLSFHLSSLKLVARSRRMCRSRPSNIYIYIYIGSIFSAGKRKVLQNTYRLRFVFICTVNNCRLTAINVYKINRPAELYTIIPSGE